MGSNQTAGHDPDEITMEEFYRLLHISKRRRPGFYRRGWYPARIGGAAPGGTGFPDQEALAFQKKFQAHPER